ncbi:hypothetical protein AJ80_09836 [Polytolypa hystricis UAMH7299]|uniref:Uracil-DNA glycosylase-like domain-containing protein n=1 Tax=Polytolypa hystricis (strain UAMH7299) TaxID=1447883 RepID=A0A2B7WIN3_POLH7|nr:hypothetical protein AJ80_09836 [Polytolypa hystricis UAMH7299]
MPLTDDADALPPSSFKGSLDAYVYESPTKNNASTTATSTTTNSVITRSTRSSLKRKLEEAETSITSTSSTLSITRSTRSRSRASISATPSPTKLKPTPSPRSGRGRGRSTENGDTTSSTTTPLSTGPACNLRDTVPQNLTLLLIGVNPGIMTGQTGHVYAHPSNLYWKLLYSSGITSRRHPPSDTYRLPQLYNIGNTNIVSRPTRDASQLSRAEMEAGVPVLEGKIAQNKPEAVCIVGKSIWETIWRVKRGKKMGKGEFRYGWQDEGDNMGRVEGGWGGARVFVATTTSGLAAGMSMAEKEAVWKELGEWVSQRRKEIGFVGTAVEETETTVESQTEVVVVSG